MMLTYKQFESLIQNQLLHLGGDAHHAFRESLIFNAQEAGYSARRAAQLVDAIEERARRT